MKGRCSTFREAEVHAGVTALPPGTYSLTTAYPGDSVYAAASASKSYAVDDLCLLEALRLAA